MNKNVQKVAAIIGLILIVSGLLVYGIYPELPGGPVSAFVGLLIVAVYIFLNRDEIKDAISLRTAKYGTNALIFIGVVFLIIVIINAISERVRYKADVTSTKVNSLTEQTEKVLKVLKKPLKIYGFIPAKDISAKEMFRSFCEKYSYSSGGKVSCEVVKPDQQPALARKYIVGSNDTQVYGFESGDMYTRVEFLTEEDFTSGIIKINRNLKKTLYFTSGHGEGSITADTQYDYNKLSIKLENLGYKVRDIFLPQLRNVPEDCSALIILSPKTAFMPQEIAKIQDYLNRGGSLLVMVDPLSNSELNPLIEQYGMKLTDNVVIDRASNLGDPFIPLINRYGAHMITQSSKGTIPQTFYNEARSIQILNTSDNNIDVKPLVATSIQYSYGERNIKLYKEQNKAKFDKDEDIPGPLYIAAAAIKSIQNAKSSDMLNNNNPSKAAKVVVFGDSDFACNRDLDFYGNNVLIMNVINWLAGDLDLISIQRPITKPNIIDLTHDTLTLIFYICTILIPIIMFITGGFIWWKKRK